MVRLLLLACLLLPAWSAEEQPIIGMTFVVVSLGEAIDHGISPQYGVRVVALNEHVYRGAPGALKVGDFIYKINGKWVHPPSLAEDLRVYGVGAEVSLFLIRGHRRLVTRVPLAGRPWLDLEEERLEMAAHIRAQTLRYERIRDLLAEMDADE